MTGRKRRPVPWPVAVGAVLVAVGAAADVTLVLVGLAFNTAYLLAWFTS